MLTKQISVSLLDCDYSNVYNQVNYLLDSGVKSLHFDLMDGSFVNALSYGPKFITDLLKHLDRSLDTSAHLMVRNAHKILDQMAIKPPKRIVVHIEDKGTMLNLPIVFKKIEKMGAGLGFAINPKSTISSIDKSYLAIASEIVVMTVEAGKGGQKMMSEMLDKITLLNEIREMNQFHFTITVDGGINDKTISEVAKYPVDQFVIGSYVWNDIQNVKNNLQGIMHLIYRSR